MVEVETPVLREVAGKITSEVTTGLEEAHELFGPIRELDQTLMVSVHPSLAAAHALAGGYAIEMVKGAAGCLYELQTAMYETADAWDAADEAARRQFGGDGKGQGGESGPADSEAPAFTPPDTYTAPDPAQFDSMEQAYGYLAPIAAVNIVLPAFAFKSSSLAVAKIIYLNQCNPGEIMKGGAYWLQLAQKYSETSSKFQEVLSALTERTWSGADRDAFDDRVSKILAQLENIQGFCMHLGISLIAIGSMLAVLIPVMVAVSAVLNALAIGYMTLRFIPPAAAMAASFFAQGQAFAVMAFLKLKLIEKPIEMTAMALAGFIGGNMIVSWANMAANGNFINPLNTIGSTGFSLLQGLANLAVVRLMAPGPGLNPVVGAGLLGTTFGQGAYGIDQNGKPDDYENSMTETGVDAGTYDFIPDTFEDQARKGDEFPEAPPPPEQKQ